MVLLLEEFINGYEPKIGELGIFAISGFLFFTLYQQSKHDANFRQAYAKAGCSLALQQL